MNIQELLSYFNVPAIGASPTVINPGPKPLVSPFGPGYSMHPELSRSAIGYFLGQTAFVTAPMALGIWSGSLFVLTASEHQVKGITGEAQLGLPVTNELIQLIGNRN